MIMMVIFYDGHSIFLMMIHTMNVTLPNDGHSIFFFYDYDGNFLSWLFHFFFFLDITAFDKLDL